MNERYINEWGSIRMNEILINEWISGKMNEIYISVNKYQEEWIRISEWDLHQWMSIKKNE